MKVLLLLPESPRDSVSFRMILIRPSIYRGNQAGNISEADRRFNSKQFRAWPNTLSVSTHLSSVAGVQPFYLLLDALFFIAGLGFLVNGFSLG